jgi:hypothetical protein
MNGIMASYRISIEKIPRYVVTGRIPSRIRILNVIEEHVTKLDTILQNRTVDISLC